MIRKLQGKVVSDKMDKTVVVLVTSLKKDSKYKKYYRTTKKFKAHDENNQYHTGDEVVISAVRPLSKDKRWRVSSLISAGKIDTPVIEDDSEEVNSEENK